MSKRSPGHAPRPRDYWATPRAAVTPLLNHIGSPQGYCEPCAGNGALIDALDGDCVAAFDIEPQRDNIFPMDTLSADLTWTGADIIITNPPWSRHILHAMIDNWSALMPTWLLFDADWMHTVQAAPYLERCCEIVSVGRVKWIADSANTGMDNCTWYLFDAHAADGPPRFYGR